MVVVTVEGSGGSSSWRDHPWVHLHSVLQELNHLATWQ